MKYRTLFVGLAVVVAVVVPHAASAHYSYSSINSGPVYYNYVPNSYYNNYYNAPVLNSLSMYSGPMGSVVTAYGSGFDLYNNTIQFGTTQIKNVASVNGYSITFIVPHLSSNQYAVTYPIAITTSHGTTGALQFTLTGYYQNPNYVYPAYYNNGYTNYYPNYNYNNNYNNNNYYYSNTPVLSSINATNVNSGSTITLYGSNFSSQNNTVYIGGTPIYNVYSNDGTSLTVTVPNLSSGNYSVYVTNSQGNSSSSLSIYVNQYYQNYPNYYYNQPQYPYYQNQYYYSNNQAVTYY